MRVLADAENIRGIDNRQKISQLVARRTTEISYLTAGHILGGFWPPDNEAAGADCLTADSVVQGCPKRIFSVDAYGDRGLIVCKRGGRPIDKFREVVEKRGFHLVLLRNFRLPQSQTRRYQACEQHEQKSC